jgi:hypothetical protein
LGWNDAIAPLESEWTLKRSMTRGVGCSPRSGSLYLRMFCMCSIMAGAKSGMRDASGTFCASAICEVLPAMQAKRTQRAKFFEVLMMSDVMNGLKNEFMMLSLQTRPHESSGTWILEVANVQRVA